MGRRKRAAAGRGTEGARRAGGKRQGQSSSSGCRHESRPRLSPAQDAIPYPAACRKVSHDFNFTCIIIDLSCSLLFPAKQIISENKNLAYNWFSVDPA